MKKWVIKIIEIIETIIVTIGAIIALFTVAYLGWLLFNVSFGL
jgi:ABC-type multidrug transport system permease subunit